MEKEKSLYESKKEFIENQHKLQLEKIRVDTQNQLQILKEQLNSGKNEEELCAEIEKNTIQNSVKPGLKIKFEKKTIHNIKKTTVLAVGCCVLFIAGKSLYPKVIDIVQNVKIEHEINNYMSNEIIDFKIDAVNPNTKHNTVYSEINNDIEESKIVHWHKNAKILDALQARTKDPIVAFYIFYNAMDPYCIEQGHVLDEYNRRYKTNYIDFDDFLLHNGFADKNELKRYVYETLKVEEEALLNGSSNIRG